MYCVTLSLVLLYNQGIVHVGTIKHGGVCRCLFGELALFSDSVTFVELLLMLCVPAFYMAAIDLIPTVRMYR